MKLVAKTSSGLLIEGPHRVIIKSIEEDVASTGNVQLRVQFESEGGNIISEWYNLKGFQQKKDGSLDYEREDKAKTEAALNRLRSLAADSSACEEGDEIEIEDLVDAEVGIYVHKNDRGNLRVRNTMDVDEVDALLDAQGYLSF